MSSEWVERSIVDVCAQVFSGGTPKSSIPEFFDRGSIPWLKTKEVNYSKIIETENFITELGLKNSSAKLVPINSVIVAMYGNGDTAGRVAINKIALTTNQACCNLVIDSARADYRFVYYYLQSQYAKLVDLKNGGAQQNLNAKLIKDYPIVVPSITEQREIGSFLESLDDRISLLCETNATLEDIAQALFKSWFVDFDPVHARARGEQPAGLAPELAALFPDSFEESALGLVPKGWKYVSLKEATDIFDSKRIPLAGQERAKRKGPYPYYGAAALMDWVDDYIFDGVYLLMGEDGSVADASGYPITQYVWGKIWVNNHAHVLQGRNGISTEHLMLALKGVNIQPFITGAVQAKLSQSNMWRIQFLMPTQSVASAFADLISPMFAKIRANSEQAQTLANLRDTLLPRLISGQLRLPDAEAQLSEVGLCQ